MTKQTILFLAANPTGTDRVALDREARAIQEELERSGYRDRFEFVTRWAARPLDLLRELRRLKPTIVHFAGHGDVGGLYFEGQAGVPQLVTADALAETFGAVGGFVRLVVLNACYSEAQAEALLREKPSKATSTDGSTARASEKACTRSATATRRAGATTMRCPSSSEQCRRRNEVTCTAASITRASKSRAIRGTNAASAWRKKLDGR